MKTKLLILIVFALIGFSSCTREYICQCEISYSGAQPGLPEPTTKEFFIKDSHKEAEAKCAENSTTLENDNIIMKQSCRLF